LSPITEFLRALTDSNLLLGLIRAGGYPVIAAIIFAETGLFFGFYLPGESLIFLAGFAAAQGMFSAATLIVLLSAMVILGDATGYGLGKWMGQPLYKKKDTWWFKRRHLLAARDFYAKHGGEAILLARFLPIVRTFAPLVAGIAGMDYARFSLYNVAGGVVWVSSMVGLGYALGGNTWVRGHLEQSVLMVIGVSFLPIMVETIRIVKTKK